MNKYELKCVNCGKESIAIVEGKLITPAVCDCGSVPTIVKVVEISRKEAQALWDENQE